MAYDTGSFCAPLYAPLRPYALLKGWLLGAKLNGFGDGFTDTFWRFFAAAAR